MPLPTPSPGQSKAEFLTTCMADPTMQAEYPDRDQRYAVCVSQFDNRTTPNDWVLHKRDT